MSFGEFDIAPILKLTIICWLFIACVVQFIQSTKRGTRETELDEDSNHYRKIKYKYIKTFSITRVHCTFARPKHFVCFGILLSHSRSFVVDLLIVAGRLQTINSEVSPEFQIVIHDETVCGGRFATCVLHEGF